MKTHINIKYRFISFFIILKSKNIITIVNIYDKKYMKNITGIILFYI